MVEPNVWRIRMKSADELVNHVAARTFAVENGVVGAGWGLSRAPDPSPLPDRCSDLNAYLHHAKIVYPSDNSVEYVANVVGKQMQIGDICWMYITHTGEYWCCRVDGDFEYRTGGPYEEHGLHLTRRCTWAKAGPADAVPGVVRRAFAGPFGAVNAIKNDATSAIKAAEIYLGTRQSELDQDLFALISPEDMEDVVSLYLQEQGWRIFPSTAKVSMACYEFVMVNAVTGRRAGVQVKSGNISFLKQDVAEDFDEFFVFMANKDATIASSSNRITRIERASIDTFARRSWELLPRRLQAIWPISVHQRS